MKDNAMPAAGLALSEVLAQYAAGFDARRIPDEVRERARLLMLDSVGIAIALDRAGRGTKKLQGICC